MVRPAPFTLPGQKKPASAALRSAMLEVQGRMVKSIVFLGIGRSPNLSPESIIQGYYEIGGDTVRVWIDAGLTHSAQEAVAAHELAHLTQRLDGFPAAMTPAEGLAARLNNLVLDDHADRWAMSRGFRIDRALQSGKLAEVRAAMAALPPTNRETAGSVDPGLALTYAGLKIRLERYGLFDELDRLWEQRWPATRAAGLRLADGLQKIPVTDPASSARALKAAAASLGIPIRLRFPREAEAL